PRPLLLPPPPSTRLGFCATPTCIYDPRRRRGRGRRAVPAVRRLRVVAGHLPRRGRRRRAGSVPHGSIDGGSAKDGGRSAMGGHLDGVLASCGEDDEEDGNPRKRKKRRPRRTPHQIQELEA
ncbi:unnamed protein product, partial [Urochloa humidicola]